MIHSMSRPGKATNRRSSRPSGRRPSRLQQLRATNIRTKKAVGDFNSSSAKEIGPGNLASQKPTTNRSRKWSWLDINPVWFLVLYGAAILGFSVAYWKFSDEFYHASVVKEPAFALQKESFRKSLQQSMADIWKAGDLTLIYNSIGDLTPEGGFRLFSGTNHETRTLAEIFGSVPTGPSRPSNRFVRISSLNFESGTGIEVRGMAQVEDIRLGYGESEPLNPEDERKFRRLFRCKLQFIDGPYQFKSRWLLGNRPPKSGQDKQNIRPYRDAVVTQHRVLTLTGLPQYKSLMLVKPEGTDLGTNDELGEDVLCPHFFRPHLAIDFLPGTEDEILSRSLAAVRTQLREMNTRPDLRFAKYMGSLPNAVNIPDDTSLKLQSLDMMSKGRLTGEDSNAYWRMFYLSAVTITTLGYGDIVPISTRARTLVAAEAILGILLIGLYLGSVGGRAARSLRSDR